MIGTHAVDVVVTVYRALDYLRPCLESVRRHDDGFDLRVIVVDDGSGPPTAEWLKELAGNWPALVVIEHEQNLGYTRAVNSGLRASNAEWVVILNSDTVVSEGWLTGMVRCAEAAPNVGLVGPLSNAASWQSVPQVFDADGRFALNALASDMDPDAMAELVRSVSKRRYPRVPVLNGFCMLLRRDVLQRVGWMDDVAFATGYGEENDYCIRASDAGFELAVADDVFVFHAKSKSFGHTRRVELSSRGAKALEAKHGRPRVQSVVRALESSTGLRAAREAVQSALRTRHERARLADPLGLRILFLLPVLSASGGANSVVMEAAEMAKLGVFVRIGVPPRALGDLGAIYADVHNVRQLLVAAPLDCLLELSENFDVVVATAAHSMEWVARIVAAHPHILPAYYVQDYEPWFFAEGSPDASAAAASYVRVPGALLFVKTHFLARTLAELQGVDATVVAPSLDHATYYASPRPTRASVRVTAMVRPQTPRRAAPRTMRVLRDLARRHGDAVEIQIFGCESSDERFQALERDFAHVNRGVLRRPEVAELLRNSDVFVDLSDYQAFGRAALEAMASGCIPVVPLAGGGAEFAVDGDNAVVVDTNSEQACVDAIAALIANRERRLEMRSAALATAARFSTRGAALSELQALATATAAWRAAHSHHPIRRRLVLANLVPPSRGRLTLGVALGAWKLPPVHRAWSVVERRRLPKPGSADVAVVLLRPEATNWQELADWLRAWRAARGRALVHVELASVTVSGERRPAFDARTLSALRWLDAAADAVCVSSAEIGHALANAELDVTVVSAALDPIVWRLGSAARRPTRQRQAGLVRVGVVGEVAHPTLISAVEQLRRTYGNRIAIETLTPNPQLARLGKRVGTAKSRSELELAEWAFDRLDWDLALISEAEPEAGLACAALGVAAVRVGGDAARALGLAGALIEDPAERMRLAVEARAALDDAREQAQLAGAVMHLLEASIAEPAPDELPAVPQSLRGFASRLLPRWRARSFLADAKPEAFPEARSNARRKLDKLRRDPAKFLRDSRVKRNLDELARRLRRSH